MQPGSDQAPVLMRAHKQQAGSRLTRRRMLLMSRSDRMFWTDEYSLQSSGSPSARFASTVS